MEDGHSPRLSAGICGGLLMRLLLRAIEHHTYRYGNSAVRSAPFDTRRQIGELESVVTSTAGSTYLAEAYTGWPGRR